MFIKKTSVLKRAIAAMTLVSAIGGLTGCSQNAEKPKYEVVYTKTLGLAGLESLKPTVREEFISASEEYGFKACGKPTAFESTIHLKERNSKTDWFVNELEDFKAFFKLTMYDVGDLKLEVVASEKRDLVGDFSTRLDTIVNDFSLKRSANDKN